MAAIYATKKSGSFLKNNWQNLAIGAVVLFIGYKVSQGFSGISNAFKGLTLPEITLPSIGNPLQGVGDALGLTGKDPSLMIMDAMPQDPNRITYTPITVSGQPVTKISQDMDGNILYNGMMQPNIVEAGGNRINPNLQSMGMAVDVNSVDIAGMFKKPITQMLQMGLAIDAPTRAGISPMATLLDMIVNKVMPVSTAKALSTGGGVLSMLSEMNPNLTASQLADLKFRLGNEMTGFDFGTNTGSGRQYQFSDMMMVAGSTRNPVLQAYENYRAQYGAA